MRIGFDAKRAFHNFTGLGNYSRTLIHSLANSFPEHHYLLFNPKSSKSIRFHQSSIQEVKPTGMLGSLFPSVWRSRWMLQEVKENCSLYHGLSHELPYGASRLSIPKVVTMHDLIFESSPQQYRKTDVLIYRRKFRYAAEVSNQIVAISEVTKRDLIHYYQIPEQKIKVVYQACDQRFYTRCTPQQSEAIRKRYSISSPYWLFVGSIIERKNLLRVCEALSKLDATMPLLVVGKGEQFKQRVIDFLKEKKLTQQVIFLEDHFTSSQIYQDLPVLYQMAFALIYPSLKEGFGLPVLEAMASGCPVITSNHTSMTETGPNTALLVEPLHTESILEAMKQLMLQPDQREQFIQTGIQAALQFTPDKCAQHMMNLYLAL